MGEVFLQAEELLFCLLFLSRKKVRAYFEVFFLRRGGAKSLTLTAEIKHETHSINDSQFTGNDPEGVEFRA